MGRKMDEVLIERFRAAMAPRIDQRRNEVARVLRGAKADAVSRGMLHSSRHAIVVAQILSEELRTRMEQGWETLRRVHGSRGSVLSVDLRACLKREIDHFVGAAQEELGEVLWGEIAWMKNPGLRGELGFAQAAATERDRYLSEVDMYVDALERDEKQADGSPTQTAYHFHGSVQVVQTGSHSIANLTGAFTPQQADQLSSALAEAMISIEKDRTLADEPRRDILALAHEADAELRKPEPNRSKIVASFGYIAQVIQTLGSAKGAWEALKSAAAAADIRL